jgi:AbrB family looped-hinge helix DNA binding protein
MVAMRVSESGRVVVPAEIRKALGIQDGDTCCGNYARARRD